MTYNDKTIPIQCAECNEEVSGIIEMILHLYHTHPSYTVKEAISHANLWARDAYEEQAEQILAYHTERKQEDRDD